MPSAMGAGEGGSFRAPMAIAVIGGIIVSTVLSLVIVPSFFLIMDDISRVLAWAFGRFVGKKETEPEAPEAAVLAERIATGRADVLLLEDRINGLEARFETRRSKPTTLHVAE